MAGIKKQMIDASDQVVLLSDSSKVNRTAFASYAPVRDVNIFITDELADPEFVESIRRLGIDIISARIVGEN
jgi:DeoR family transcriptional regulator of aga operon